MSESGLFDVRSLGLLSVTAPLLFALATLYLHHLWPPERSLPYWAAAGFCLAAGYALNAVRGIAPDFLVLVVANVAGFASLCLFVVAGRILLGLSSPTRWLWWAIPAAALFQWYFTYRQPDLGVRVLASTLANLAIMSTMASLLWRHSSDRLRVPGRAMAVIFAVTSMIFVVRIWALREVSADAQLESVPTVVWLTPFLTGFVATVGLATLLTLAVSYQIEAELTAERQRTESANRELQRLSEIDDLTGLSNRGQTENLLTRAAVDADAASSTEPLIVIMLDVDGFKAVNDTFGHAVGDTVLQDTATALREAAGSALVVGRWGGEEFLVVITGIDLKAAAGLAEVLRHHVEQVRLPDGGPVTASFGIAQRRPEESVSSVVSRADDALYAAKAHGRNRVEIA